MSAQASSSTNPHSTLEQSLETARYYDLVSFQKFLKIWSERCTACSTAMDTLAEIANKTSIANKMSVQDDHDRDRLPCLVQVSMYVLGNLLIAMRAAAFTPVDNGNEDSSTIMSVKAMLIKEYDELLDKIAKFNEDQPSGKRPEQDSLLYKVLAKWETAQEAMSVDHHGWQTSTTTDIKPMLTANALQRKHRPAPLPQMTRSIIFALPK